MTDEDLQDPEEWDADTRVKRPGVKGRRAVVSVAFSRDDFERIVQASKRMGMKTSEYVRNGVLNQLNVKSTYQFQSQHSPPPATESRSTTLVPARDTEAVTAA